MFKPLTKIRIVWDYLFHSILTNYDEGVHLQIVSCCLLTVLPLGFMFIVMQKQFKQPNVTQRPVPKKDDSSQGVPVSFSGRDQGNVLGSDFHVSQLQNKHEPAPSEEKPISVHDRLRIPVSYDDDLLGENPVNDAT